jgi:hypothetical protein
MSNQNLEIVPSNVTSDGTLSFSNGQPVIQFIIGEQSRYLLGQTVRLVGNFSVLSASGELGADNALLSMDGRTSIYSTIDQVVIKSQSTNQTIEHIRNYNRFMASWLNATGDLGDGLSHKNEAGLQVLNSEAIQTAVVDNQSNRGKSNTFSLSLPCGLFNGTGPIPLAKEWGLGGLIIEVHLASDNNVLFSTDGDGTQVPLSIILSLVITRRLLLQMLLLILALVFLEFYRCFVILLHLAILTIADSTV